MSKGIPREEALRYHRKLPKRLWRYLRSQGFADSLVHSRLLGYDGKHITVPVFDERRELIFFEYLSDHGLGPIQVVEHTRPYESFLYGFDTLETRPSRVVLVRDVWDRLVLLSRGIPAVGIIGDSREFREEWSSAFQGIEVVIVFPRGGSSYREAQDLASKLGTPRIAELPALQAFFSHSHRTVAAFFLYHGGSKASFLHLLPRSERGEKGQT